MAKGQEFVVRTAFDARDIISKGELASELEMKRAVFAERILRLLSREQPDLDNLRKQVRELVVNYESKYWSDSNLITDEQIQENELAEEQVEKEQTFFKKRKQLITNKLKKFDLNQNDLAAILAHSKSYTSELLSGTRSFSMNDLVIVHKLFGISLNRLIYTDMPAEVQERIDEVLQKIKTRSEKKGSSSISPVVKSLAGVLKLDEHFNYKADTENILGKSIHRA